jgi:hypothetical protein
VSASLIFGTSIVVRPLVGPPCSSISFYKAPFIYIDRVSRACAVAGPMTVLQKYPSFFLRSIDAALSLSMSRPCRSEKRLPRNSSMMRWTVAASDSIPPERG